jgi:PAS domain S-box-containing protein
MVTFQVYDVLHRLEIVIDTEQHRLVNLVRALGEQTGHTLQTVDVLLREAAEDFLLARSHVQDHAIETRLQARIDGVPQITSLLIKRADAGRVPAAAHLEAMMPEERSGRAGLDVTTSSTHIYEAQHRPGQIPGVVSVVRRIEGRRGELLGIAIAELNLHYFEQFYSSIDLVPGSTITLFNVESGSTIALFPAQRRATGIATEVPLLQRLVKQDGAAVLMLAGALDGRERIYAVQPVPRFPLAVGASVDKAAVLAPWYVQAMHSAVRTSLLCASVGLLMWLVMRQLRRRERAEQRLLVQTALLDELFESAPEAIVMVDQQRRVMRMNREFNAMFGYTAEEARGRTLDELIMPAELLLHDRGTPLATIERVAVETERIRKDGRRLHVSMLAAPILTAAGQIASYTIFRDITERKLAEAERAKLETRLRQAEKLEAIGTMAGGIAHDFSSVLTAILSYGDLALQAAPAADSVRRYVERVMAAAHRAKALVNQILTYSRSTQGKRHVMRICETIEEVLFLVRASLPGNVELRALLAAPEAEVMADPTQVHQVVTNLCSNAVQAMPSGGTLEVCVEIIETSSERALSHGLLPAGRHVRLTVSDTGSGIEPEVMDRIFEPFFTTKLPGSGTGLGLALVHGIITELGGAMHVASRPAAGSTFDIYLPRADPAEGAGRIDAQLPRGRGERVLLVEDEKPLMLLAEEMLAALNFEPAGFTHAPEALAEFRVDPWRFDLVILDHLMPETNGIELARQLRRARPDVPIILMSGYTGPLLMHEAVNAGIQRIVTKPLELESLADVIAHLLARASAR